MVWWNPFDDDDDAEKFIEGDDEIAEEQRFQKQCFLMENLKRFQLENKKHLYENLVLMDGEPSIVTNLLTARAGVEELFKLTPQQLSLLTPSLRLYKVEYPRGTNKEGILRELNFTTALSEEDISNITKNRQGRASGIGLKSFEWDYLGRNPAEATRKVTCNLVMFFQNIEDLIAGVDFDPETNPEGTTLGEANFTDLFTHTSEFIKKGEGCEKERVYNSKYFRIRAEVGWALPPKTDLISSEVREIIGSMKTVLILSLGKHSIDFNENGSLTLKISYKGALESSMQGPDADILSIKEPPKPPTDLPCVDGKIDDPPDKPDRDEVEEEAKRVEGALSEKRLKRYRSLLQTLRDTERIFFVDVPKWQLGQNKDGDQLTREEQAKRRDDPPGEGDGPEFNSGEADGSEPLDRVIEDSAEEDAKDADFTKEVTETSSQADKEVSPDVVRVNFVYYGDILNAVASLLNKPGTSILENTRIMLGPIVFHDKKRKGQKQMVNLADIPISLDLFIVWWTNKVIKPGGVNHYYLQSFIQDSIKELIVVALGATCATTNLKQHSIVGLSSIATKGIGPSGATPRLSNNTRNSIENLLLVTGGIERKGIAGIHHYLFAYASSEPADTLDGNREEDMKRGIYHLGIGEEGGIVKSIKFSQTSQKYNKEAQWEREGAGLAHFRERYNATVELVGNMLFYPGCQVYINPSISGLGSTSARNSLVQKLGIGGYYNIGTVSNTMDEGGFQTNITCIWTSPGKGNTKTPKESDDDGILGPLGDYLPKIELPDSPGA